MYHKVTKSRMTHRYLYDGGYAQRVSDSFTQIWGTKPASIIPPPSMAKNVEKS